MNKQAPSTGRILTMVAFAASCVGLLLFLWISFGGSIPLAPQGYRLNAEFNEAVAARRRSPTCGSPASASARSSRSRSTAIPA